MTAQFSSFALLGAKPIFENPIPIGQLYCPSWQRYETAFKGIFERQYYNNNGPLLDELEQKLVDLFGVKHVVCVSNCTIGLMIAADALGLTGKVVLPSFTFIASAQSMSWAGLEPVFCDVNPRTHQIDIDQLDALIDEDVSAILGVNLWGGACDPIRLETYAKDRGVKLLFDSAQAFGCVVEDTSVANFGSLEVFSFHATKILSATEGGCICTNDDDLADQLRGIRPSYGNDTSSSVKRVANGRMSEAQAAIALMSLEDFPQNQKKNEKLFHKYKTCLSEIPGIKLIEPAGVTFSNYQYIVCEVDEEVFGMPRDSLIATLKAENVFARRYFYPGVHRSAGYNSQSEDYSISLPVTEQLCSSCIQFPIGAMVDESCVELICGIIDRSHRNSQLLNAFLAEV